MGLADILLIGVGLSMDAFAVALCKGLCMRKFQWGQAIIIALFFGAFQALMPAIGFFLGSRFAEYIRRFDYLVAFGLLAFIGGKMLYDAIWGESETTKPCQLKIDYRELLMLSVATSIDALAVGIAFSVQNVKILPSVAMIGVTTLILSFIGVAAGNKFGAKYEKKAQILGGAVLIGIGIKIVLEHFSLWPF